MVRLTAKIACQPPAKYFNTVHYILTLFIPIENDIKHLECIKPFLFNYISWDGLGCQRVPNANRVQIYNMVI